MKYLEIFTCSFSLSLSFFLSLCLLLSLPLSLSLSLSLSLFLSFSLSLSLSLFLSMNFASGLFDLFETFDPKIKWVLSQNNTLLEITFPSIMFSIFDYIILGKTKSTLIYDLFSFIKNHILKNESRPWTGDPRKG